MEERKNLCAQISLSLHNRVREGQTESGQTLSEYVTEILTEYFEGGNHTMASTRTLAFQISEELFQRIKDYLAQESERSGRKISQKEFVIGLIEEALEEAEAEAAAIAELEAGSDTETETESEAEGETQPEADTTAEIY